MTDINTILSRYLARFMYQFNKKDKDYFIDFLLNQISDVLPIYLNAKDVNFKKFYHKFKLGEDILAELENDDFFRNLNPNDFSDLFINYSTLKLDTPKSSDEEEDIPRDFEFNAKFQLNEEIKIKYKRSFVIYIKKYILLVELQAKLTEIKFDKFILDSTENEVELNSKVSNLKKEFKEFNFDDVTNYNKLSEEQKNTFLKKIIISENELKVALLYKLGFTISKVYTKEKIYKFFSKNLDIQHDKFKKLVLVINPKSTVSKKTYRTNEYFQEADKFIESLN